MRLATLLMCLTAAAVLADDPEPKGENKARELDVKDLKITAKPGGKGLKPTKITTDKELADAVTDKDARDAIAKKVDLKKEYVLLFAWSGSGGDKLSMEVKKGDKGDEAVFTVKRGLTRDLRRHVKVFAIPAKMTHKVAE